MTEIDVSECRYYRKNKECDIWGIPCQMKEFCYFKILKQETAKLKDLLETRCYNEVEFENKKLKEALEEIKRTAEEQIKRYPDSFKFKDSEYNTIIEICDEVLKDE